MLSGEESVCTKVPGQQCVIKRGPKESRDPWKGPKPACHTQEALNLTNKSIRWACAWASRECPTPVLRRFCPLVLSVLFGVTRPGLSGLRLVCVAGTLKGSS